MNSLTQIGNSPWSREEIIADLEKFADLYNNRPIKDNQGGMKASNMFATWYIAKNINPDIVVESGVWKGQSTWLLEQACPDADIISIDIDLSKRIYISDKVKYLDHDFATIDWSNITDRSLVFFDDHQNAYQRIQQSLWAGFKHIIFEDNYPPNHGDCYSLKTAFSNAGFTPQSNYNNINQTSFSYKLLRKFCHWNKINLDQLISCEKNKTIKPNDINSKMLLKNLLVYFEFPPIYKTECTRWGDDWNNSNYPTPEALLDDNSIVDYPDFHNEAQAYNWICYTQLK